MKALIMLFDFCPVCCFAVFFLAPFKTVREEEELLEDEEMLEDEELLEVTKTVKGALAVSQ